MQIKHIHVHTARNLVVRERSQGERGFGAVERVCARAITVAVFPSFACVLA